MLDNSNNTMMSESRFKSSANLMKNYYDLDNAWLVFLQVDKHGALDSGKIL